MTPAQECAAAADHLDALIVAATRGPWRYDTPWYHTARDATAEPTGLLTTAGRRNPVLLGVPSFARNAPNSTRAEANLRYVEAMNPLTGRAMVGVLRERAEELADLPPSEQDFVVGATMPEDTQDQVWRLARAILATKEGT